MSKQKELNYMPPEEGFLGMPQAKAVAPEAAKVVIIPFGLEASVSYGAGTALGPKAMIAASHEVELFDEELWCEPVWDIGFATLVEPEIAPTVAEALEGLEHLVSTVLDNQQFPLVFGGEHSISAGSIRPFARKYKDLVILHIDAHADLRDGYEGEHYSHAAALRRCLDFEHVELVSVGIRNISAEEIPFLEANKNRIDIHWAIYKETWDFDAIAQKLSGRPVYITFDLDAFDSSVMPATGTPEPGGMVWLEAMHLLRKVCKVAHVVGADINELAPKENLHACNFLAARLAYKLSSYALLKP